MTLIQYLLLLKDSNSNSNNNKTKLMNKNKKFNNKHQSPKSHFYLEEAGLQEAERHMKI